MRVNVDKPIFPIVALTTNTPTKSELTATEPAECQDAAGPKEVAAETLKTAYEAGIE